MAEGLMTVGVRGCVDVSKRHQKLVLLLIRRGVEPRIDLRGSLRRQQVPKVIPLTIDPIMKATSLRRGVVLDRRRRALVRFLVSRFSHKHWKAVRKVALAHEVGVLRLRRTRHIQHIFVHLGRGLADTVRDGVGGEVQAPVWRGTSCGFHGFQPTAHRSRAVGFKGTDRRPPDTTTSTSSRTPLRRTWSQREPLLHALNLGRLWPC
mmetsp:Transcript_8074/g.14520  ORF Transcript_8074/g.14520 Transcript_8074/m.14520 type:complete len:206 (+) Transcript_8074:1067-1684(+)